MPFAFGHTPLYLRPELIRFGWRPPLVTRLIAMKAGSSDVFLNILPAILLCGQMFRCALEKTGVAP